VRDLVGGVEGVDGMGKSLDRVNLDTRKQSTRAPSARPRGKEVDMNRMRTLPQTDWVLSSPHAVRGTYTPAPHPQSHTIVPDHPSQGPALSSISPLSWQRGGEVLTPKAAPLSLLQFYRDFPHSL